MNKSGILITSALLTFGIAAAAMADTPPKATATMPADTMGAEDKRTVVPPGPPTVGPKEDQRAVNTSPPKSTGKSTTHKHKKSHKPATPAATTTATPAPTTTK
jgi:hypothetical protein